MKDHELFELFVERLREAKLLSDEELFEYRESLASILNKLHPRRQGRPSGVPNPKVVAARVELFRSHLETLGVPAAKTKARQLVAESLRGLGIKADAGTVREIDRKFTRDETKRFIDRLKQRMPDILPTTEEIEKKLV